MLFTAHVMRYLHELFLSFRQHLHLLLCIVTVLERFSLSKTVIKGSSVTTAVIISLL